MSVISVNISKFFIFAFLVFAGVVFFCAGAGNVYAQAFPEMAHDSGYEDIYAPVMTTTSIVIDDDEDPAMEPNIGQARFIKYPQLTSLDERIDRLLHGVEVYVRPEYDHYGHEIRRYMSRVGNMKVFDDPDFVIRQYRNARKARVIANFWRDYLDKEIEDIEEIIETDDSVSLGTRTAFRQNKLVMRSFLMSLKAWVDSNEQILRKVGENQELYSVEYPEILVANPKDRVDFHNLLSIRAAKLKDIRKYSPFALMVY